MRMRTLVALGCSESPLAANGPGASAVDVPSDVAPDAKPDVAPNVATDVAPDVATDVATDGPAPCTGASDCAAMAGRGVCDTATGRCVQCVAAMDTCPATELCNAALNACESGCRSDEGCAGMSGGGDGDVARTRCDADTHTCVECATDAHRAAGSHGVGGGRAGSLPNATPARAAGACTVAACATGCGDCDGAPADGCETDVRSAASHCGACGRACTYANATGVCGGGSRDGGLQRWLLRLRLQPGQRL